MQLFVQKLPGTSPEGIRKSIDNCLKLLDGRMSLDVFEPARVDKNVPIKTKIKIMEEDYVKTGKIGGIALTEISATTIERAVKVTNTLPVEIELSILYGEALTNGIAQSCAKHNSPSVSAVRCP